MKVLTFLVVLLLGAAAYGQFPSHSTQSSVDNSGQSTGLVLNQNVGHVAQAASGGKWHYERYEYYQCGRQYYGYRPVFVENKVEQAAQPLKQEINPIGSVNTDNSVTHSYTYNITYGQLPVAQGNTLYGYSYSSVADVYGNTDIGAMYNLAIRLAGDQVAVSDKATGNAMALVAQAGRERSRIVEILAKGQVIAQANASAAALAQSISPGPSVDVQSSTTRGSGQTEIVKQPSGRLEPGAVQQVFDKNCVSCHRQGVEKGGLSLEDASKLSGEDVGKILDRVTSADPKRRMPQASDGHGGASLSLEEIATLFKAASN